MTRERRAYLIGLGKALERIEIGALNHGPLIFEAWKCEKCEVINWETHRFKEVLACGNCKQRIASKVPLYKFAMNEAADNGGSRDAKGD